MPTTSTMPRVALALALAATLACRPAAEPGALAAPRVDAAGSTSTSTSAATAPASEGPLRVAVTFDDLPSHGPRRPGEGLLDVHRAILDVVDAHRVPAVYGFVNGGKLADDPEGRAVLELWRDRGHPLGNHTLSHVDLGVVGAPAFLAEVAANDAVLAEIVGDDEAARRARRVFRYPYLRQGQDRPTLDAVRDGLAGQGYRLGEVTVDFGDWAYNAPYVRCVAAGDDAAIEDLRWSFVAGGLLFLRWSDAASKAIFGRRIPQVLLLHSGSFDAAVLDALLTAYERREGVVWVSLDEALADPAYQRDVRAPSRHGGTLLEQIIDAEAAPHPPMPLQPLGLLEHVCRRG